MPLVETELKIHAPASEIYTLVADMASYPNFMQDVVSVEILEKGENFDLSHWVTNADGRKIVWTERDDFFPDDWCIKYNQTEGDLQKMTGEWRIIPEGEECLVRLSVDFEFGIPMIAGLLNPLLKRKVRENSENMLAAVKRRVEKQR